MPEVVGGTESDEEEIVKLEMKDLSDTTDIFDNGEVAKPPVEVAKSPVKKERKKRVMSEEHKQKLAQARVKALEVRRENARQKKEIKDLKKQQKDNELEDLRASVGKKMKASPPKPVEVKKVVNKETEEEDPNFVYEEFVKVEEPKEVNSVGKSVRYKYTQEDVDNITFKAISNYDALRKERKKEKEIIRKDEAHKEAERQKMMRVATGLKTSTTTNMWDNCY